MSTIRELDAAWNGHSRLTPMADRHTLLVAGDALAEAVTVFTNHHRNAECIAFETECQAAEDAVFVAHAAWKAATG